MPLSAVGGHNGRVRPSLADELEEFVRAGALWDLEARNSLIASLEVDAAGADDSLAALLIRSLRGVGLRAEMGPIPRRVAKDVEGIAYPRLWKIVEAIRDQVPDGELRVRIDVFNRRLSRCFVDEQRAGVP
jgi:hypothetical protein